MDADQGRDLRGDVSHGAAGTPINFQGLEDADAPGADAPSQTQLHSWGGNVTVGVAASERLGEPLGAMLGEPLRAGLGEALEDGFEHGGYSSGGDALDREVEGDSSSGGADGAVGDGAALDGGFEAALGSQLSSMHLSGSGGGGGGGGGSGFGAPPSEERPNK